MNLSFYESLSADQKNLANQIAERAKALGIPPEFAVAIAYQESRLNPKVGPGSVGEIGLMQVRPETGKELGFSAQDLRDPNKNIDAGLAYLKKSLELSGGDTRLAAAGYNAGVNHPFFSNDKAKLPDTTVKYLESLKGFGAFTGPQVGVEEGGEEEIPKETRRTTEDIEQGRAETAGAMLGGGAGTALTAARVAAPVVAPVARGAAALASKVMSPAARQAAELVAGQRPIGPTAPTAMPTPSAGMPAAGAPTPPRATGPGSAVVNYAKAFGLPDIEAGRATSMSAEPGGAWDLLNRRQQALSNISQRFPSERYIENPRFGGLMTPDQGPGPRASFVSQPGGLQPLPPRAPVPTAPVGALEQVKGIFMNMLGPNTVGRAAIRYAAPPLAGMQIGKEVGTLLTEGGREEPDYTKMALSGLSALGAGMSLFPVTAPIGIPLAIGAPLTQAYREKMQGALPTTTEVVAP
jgi:hypothetical protein